MRPVFLISKYMFFQHAQRKTVIEKFRLESPEIIIIIIIKI